MVGLVYVYRCYSIGCRNGRFSGCCCRSRQYNVAEYKKFLIEIGYIVPEGSDFKITTSNIDPEISSIPGPQLVVPITNARYAINAVNARWGSLYDALYGTDMIDGERQFKGYSKERGVRAVSYTHLTLPTILLV